MRRYLVRRLLLVIPTVLGVTMIIFVAMRLLPGDPLVAMFGLEGARRMTPEQRAHLEQALGIRDPYVVQYGKWLRDIGTGQFGKSLLRGDSVTQLVLRRGPVGDRCLGDIALLDRRFSRRDCQRRQTQFLHGSRQ